jgi:hypothetical protein
MASEGYEPDTTSLDAPSLDRFDEQQRRDREAARAGSCAALKDHGPQPGEVRNPEGKNSRKLMAAVRRFMDQAERRDELVRVAFERAMAGNVAWGRFLAEYDDGKPTQAAEAGSSGGTLRERWLAMRAATPTPQAARQTPR